MFLYVRMLVMMAVSLFTFRELIKQLGVVDYGIYNVVGGVIVMFSFLSSAVTQANQRFLSFYLSKGDQDYLNKVFSIIINVQIIISFIIVFFAETVGLWFLNTQMNFDNEKMSAVNWVYQFSILTFVIQLMQIPYTSAIIAHEQMSFFSYFSMGEAFIKLGIVFALGLFTSGKLILYSIFLSVAALIIWGVYYVYCSRTFDICRYHLVWDKKFMSEIISFSGWNILGGLGNVGAGQGINILLNIFCGVVVNAAMGVSHQVSAAVTSFVSSMQMAFNPQIVKSYAADDRDYCYSLVFRAGRLSFYLIFMIGFPVILCASPILQLWLTDVPTYAVTFTQLTIIWCIIDAVSGPLWMATQATGKVKYYTIILTSLLLLNLPVSYILLKMGYSPVYVLGVRVIITFIIHLFRIAYLHKMIHFPGTDFFRKVTLKGVVTVLLSLPVPFILELILPDNLHGHIVLFVVSLTEVAILGFFLLLTKTERDFILNKLQMIRANIKTN